MDGIITSLYATMARIRAFEERVAKHFRAGDIHGFVHTSIGQEAVAAGACAALGKDDVITTTHRGHGHCIAKGAEPAAMMAELFGRVTGVCAGKGGSMHIADPSVGILGANGIVGAGIPLAAGAALAARTRHDSRVAVAFFGEGAVHCGAFHEGVTLAVAWSLPLVLICENNGYAEFTAAGAWGGPTLVERAETYGLSAVSLAGDDPLAVHGAVSEAVERARSGGGPALIEAEVSRFGGHYEGDAQDYRTQDELSRALARDPLAQARELVGPSVADKLVLEAQREMDAAVAAALEDAYPLATSVDDQVYA